MDSSMRAPTVEQDRQVPYQLANKLAIEQYTGLDKVSAATARRQWKVVGQRECDPRGPGRAQRPDCETEVDCTDQHRFAGSHLLERPQGGDELRPSEKANGVVGDQPAGDAGSHPETGEAQFGQRREPQVITGLPA